MPVMTKFRLKTCVPYSIKYPIPFLLTKNSPMMTPIKVSDMFIFRELAIVCRLAGMTSLVRI